MARIRMVAPYEEPAPGAKPRPNAAHLVPVTTDHGGYGVLVVEGYIHGPFCLYENALKASARNGSGRVVRWADFITESVADVAFRKRLLTLVRPLTLPVYGYRQLAPVVWPD
jgi:hypothetical protein